MESAPAAARDLYVIGCDIGGTFTDFVVADTSTGQLAVKKLVTTPSDPSRAVIDGVRALAAENPALLGHTAELVHATTLVVNAVIEGKGARTALVTTAGFRDLLEVRRHVRVSNFEMMNDPREPLVPRALRIALDERTYSDGRILTPLDETEIDEAIQVLRERGVESVAVSFLHSYANATNEHRLAEAIARACPDLPVSLSSRVLPEKGEYERTVTTVVNAYVKPVASRYLDALRERLAAEGLEAELRVMLSNGGLAAVRTASEFPVRFMESGPAAGAVAARHYGALAGLDRVLAFDMGGTTAKASLILDGELPLTSTLEIARTRWHEKRSGYPVAVPSLDLLEVGAGGGSIAAVNDLGLLQVGPESAGADPGPACYGFGGTSPTVTDADLVLGYLDPDYFLGGDMRLDPRAAADALRDGVARPSGRELIDAAWTVHDVVNESMAAAMKIHVLEKGGDPALVSLVAFGGAGPVHACNVAAKLGARTVLVPPRAGVMSAVGLLATPPSYDLTRTHDIALAALDPATLAAVFEELEEEVRGQLRHVGSGADVAFTRWVDVGYLGQGHQVPVPVPDPAALSRDDLWSWFVAEYASRYGHSYDDVPAGITRLRVNGRLVRPGLALLEPTQPGRVEDAVKGRREAYSGTLGAMVEHTVYDRYRLAPGMRFEGPAIVEERESTTVVGARSRAEVDERGVLVVTLPDAAPRADRYAAASLDVVWPRLVSIADEMATTLVRTAHSHDVVEVHDMSTAIYDAAGTFLAMSAVGAHSHVYSMARFISALLEEVPPERMREGDAFVTNDPWLNPGHTADVLVGTPVFVHGRLVGFTVTSAHQVDMGGRGGSGHTEEVYEEGLILPIMHLYRAGEPNEELFRLLRRNVRFQDRVVGDFRAQASACHVGGRRLIALLEEQDIDSLDALGGEIVSRTEASLRKGIARLPDGRYEARIEMDHVAPSGDPVQLCVAVTIRGDTMEFDFEGTSPQVRRPINDPIQHVAAYAVAGVKVVCDPHLPNNAGALRPIRISAPEACVLNARFPAPTFWRLTSGMLVPEIVFSALSGAAPNRTPAESGSMPTWQFYIYGFRRSGEPFVLHQHAFGGMGGRPGRDGLASVSFPYSVREVPTEVVEIETPLLVERRELIRDSGGAGRWRGGLGEEIVIRLPPDADVDTSIPLLFSGAAGRFRRPAAGRFGGRAGRAARILLNDEPLDPDVHGNSPELRFTHRDVLTLELPGGGGYGLPAERTPAEIEADVENGYVSAEAALEHYGHRSRTATAQRTEESDER